MLLICTHRYQNVRKVINKVYVYLGISKSNVSQRKLQFCALLKYLQNELERLQRRALSIINPGLTYHEALSESNIPTIMSYSNTICRTFFDSAVNDKYNKLNKLLPPTHETTYELRQNRRFDIPNWSTNRFRDTFIMASAINNGC